jgi:tetratricopeptide (TPR) repeat protein
MSRNIEAAIQSEEWKKARQLIRAELKKKPLSHWLLTRLGSTYYEERAYRVALSYEMRAFKLAPKCPLVLWDYAGTLQALGKHKFALRVYCRLTSRGIDSIAFGNCGEGLARARGLVADCHYRKALSYLKIGRPRAAINAYRTHLRMRGPGCRSIYAMKAIKKELATLINPNMGGRGNNKT